MASTRELAIRIVGDPKSAVGALDKVGDAAERQKRRFDKVKTGITIGSAAMVAGVTAFAVESVQAFAAAQESQRDLEYAFEQFPALADTNIEALRELNETLSEKTRFDDDAIASGQAVLAQFDLTGQQIAEITPLLADYAEKTGKDLPAAAQDVGKALLGNAKALKNVGIFYKSTGDAGEDFANISALLEEKVGGFAETAGSTAAGKLQILQNRFEDIQETVGELLMPALEGIVDTGRDVVNWANDNEDVVTAMAIAVGGLVAVVVALNAAMWALALNPVVAVITATIIEIGALVGAIVYLLTHFEEVKVQMMVAFSEFGVWWRRVTSEIWNWVTGRWQGIEVIMNDFLRNLRIAWSSTWSSIANVVRYVWNNIVTWIEGGVNGAIDLINGLISGFNTVGGVVGIHLSLMPDVHLPRLAAGTVTSGPMAAIIGDNPGGREVVAPYDSYVKELRRAAGVGGGGDVKVVIESKRDGVRLEDLIDVRIERADRAARRVSRMGKLA